jgi:thiosulfate reductase cytochrome b subunit
MQNPIHVHKFWIRISHWVVTFSFFALLFTGAEMTMTHPRFYWGEVGNELTPALFELPVSRNYQHGGWTNSTKFLNTPGSPVSAGRTYDIFNYNGWGRSLHFLSAWFLFFSGVTYFLFGLFTKHFKKKILPKFKEIKFKLYWNDFLNHFKKALDINNINNQYGLLQKTTYAVVIFLVMPVVILTGLTMSPAITAVYPFLLKLWGAQSARTIHFFASTVLLLFLVVHLTMIIRTGFKKQISQMITGH